MGLCPATRSLPRGRGAQARVPPPIIHSASERSPSRCYHHPGWAGFSRPRLLTPSRRSRSTRPHSGCRGSARQAHGGCNRTAQLCKQEGGWLLDTGAIPFLQELHHPQGPSLLSQASRGPLLSQKSWKAGGGGGGLQPLPRPSWTLSASHCNSPSMVQPSSCLEAGGGADGGGTEAALAPELMWQERMACQGKTQCSMRRGFMFTSAQAATGPGYALSIHHPGKWGLAREQLLAGSKPPGACRATPR